MKKTIREYPRRLYHKTARAGKIFRTEEEAKEAMADGWVDTVQAIDNPPPIKRGSGRPTKVKDDGDDKDS